MTPTDQAKRQNTPPLQGSGRGWGLSANTLARSHAHARQMRNTPTAAEQRLWAKLSRAQLQGHKFRRQAAIGPYIADFLCPAKGLIVEVDGPTHDAERDAVRDAALQAQGHLTLRVTNGDVMQNLDGVLQTILNALESLPSRHTARPHPNPAPIGEGTQ